MGATTWGWNQMAHHILHRLFLSKQFQDRMRYLCLVIHGTSDSSANPQSLSCGNSPAGAAGTGTVKDCERNRSARTLASRT
jgi:hypothetical protein